MVLSEDVLSLLQETSRTFFLPIRQLPAGLQEAIAAAYLSMRAIDEIEDHPYLESSVKSNLLLQVSQQLQSQVILAGYPSAELLKCFSPFLADLPEVTRRLADWVNLPDDAIAPRIWEATATMAERMASWVEHGWSMKTEYDLNRYTYAVAGATGVLLCDLWAWADGEQLNRSAAIQFGRGLQAVNILRNRADDLERGVDFFPTGWTLEQMHLYASKYLTLADTYAQTLPPAPFEALIQIPLALARATLHVLEQGERKLSRHEVLRIIGQIQAEKRG
jgi:farnesyl-diphosphate farnesyltransferase